MQRAANAVGVELAEVERLLRLRAARGTNELADLELPERFFAVPSDFPRGDPFNVGQMYSLFAESIRKGQSLAPTFETAVQLHRLVDAMKQASDNGREASFSYGSKADAGSS